MLPRFLSDYDVYLPNANPELGGKYLSLLACGTPSAYLQYLSDGKLALPNILASWHRLRLRLGYVTACLKTVLHVVRTVAPLQIGNRIVGSVGILVVNVRLALGGWPEKRPCHKSMHSEVEDAAIPAQPDSPVSENIRISNQPAGPSAAAVCNSLYSPKARHRIIRCGVNHAPFFVGFLYDWFSHRRVSSQLRDSGGQRSFAVAPVFGLARLFYHDWRSKCPF